MDHVVVEVRNQRIVKFVRVEDRQPSVLHGEVEAAELAEAMQGK